jgi:hypothetical protein
MIRMYLVHASLDGAMDERRRRVLYYEQSTMLFTCTQCALIIGNLWLVGDVGIRKRVLTLLHQRSQTLADLRAVLKEHHDSLGDEGGQQWQCT